MAYASTEELARILKIRSASDEQDEALERVLEAAYGEILSETGIADGEEPDDWECVTSGRISAAAALAIATDVNLKRAAELWKETEIQWGVIGLGENVAYTGTDTWKRHAEKLVPLKQSWGIA